MDKKPAKNIRSNHVKLRFFVRGFQKNKLIILVKIFARLQRTRHHLSAQLFGIVIICSAG